MRLALALLLLARLTVSATGDAPDGIEVPYRDGVDHPRCRVRLALPENAAGFPTVVWFHGGGLTGGGRHVPPGLVDRGVGVVAAGYRLSPEVTVRQCIEDAAAAVDWTLRNIERYGGDPGRVVVSGHSAGGYLTLMLALDPRYLAAHDRTADDLAAFVPLSGHTITHFTRRSERGLGRHDVRVDELAPLFHLRPRTPPIRLVTGDRDLELLGRYEENAYFARMMKVVGNDAVELFELQGFDHGGMVAPAIPLVAQSALTTRPSPVRTPIPAR